MTRDAKPPAFQFYPADFLSDANVACMTLAAQGAYVRLLCHCWLQGKLPRDAKKLAALAGVNGRGEWPTLWEQIKPCFKLDGRGSYVNPRLVRERQKQIDWRKKSSRGGSASGKSRRSKELAKGGSILDEPNAKGGSRVVQPKANTSSSSSSSSSTSEANSLPRDDEILAAFDRFWEAWPRKEKRLAAQRSYLAAIGDLPPPDELLRIVGQWTPVWLQSQPKFRPMAHNWLDERRWTDELPDAEDEGTVEYELVRK